jgi:chromate transporter
MGSDPSGSDPGLDGGVPGTLADLARYFLWLGTFGFGGPVVHLALLEEHVVRRRGWLTIDEFIDLLGLTNIIPGPNSTEMAMAIGFRRAGYAGLAVAGSCFILPAVCLTMALGWLYARYGYHPAVEGVLAGLGPAVIVVMLQGAWRLGREAFTTPRAVAVAAVVLALSLAGIGEITLLLGAAIVGAVTSKARPGPAAALTVLALIASPIVALAATADPPALTSVGAFFLRVGAVLYGGGYVLVALLEPLVSVEGWITSRQLVHAVAAGQVTPGPVLTTATFVGYLLGGPSSAVVATIAIFLPAFVFTTLLGPLTPRLRRATVIRSALQLVSVASVALIGAVTLQLGVRVFTDPFSVVPLAAAVLVAARGGSSAWTLAAGMIGSAAVALLR